ncbi:hypothetical protein TNCV_1305791 [Trichonephila clavipes]|nr:hypothetical protein TNCV_1305791 [Trichonephila clavipes]
MGMNEIRKTPAGLDCPIALSEDFITVDDDNVCTAPIMADKDSASGSGRQWPEFPMAFQNCLGHDSIFVNVCGDEVLCSSEGQGNFRLSQLGSLLGFLVGSFIAEDNNMTWDPL